MPVRSATLRPAMMRPARAPRWDPDYLHHEIADRLRKDDVVFDLFLQPYVDESNADRGRIDRMDEGKFSPGRVATLTIPGRTSTRQTAAPPSG